MLLGIGRLATSSRQVRLALKDVNVRGMIGRERLGDNLSGMIYAGPGVIKLALDDVEPCRKDPASCQRIMLWPEGAFLDLPGAIRQIASIGIVPNFVCPTCQAQDCSRCHRAVCAKLGDFDCEGMLQSILRILKFAGTFQQRSEIDQIVGNRRTVRPDGFLVDGERLAVMLFCVSITSS